MDQPLLALTRGRSPSGAGPSIESTAIDNMRQLIQLRWIAVGGQLLTILAVNLGLGAPLPMRQLLLVVALLALANIAASVSLRRHHVTNAEIMLALLLDIAALTTQLYFSGGATNPFISLYLLQVVLGAILLERWSAWVLVAVTSLCFGGLTIDYVPLVLPSNLLNESTDPFALGRWISFALSGTLLGLFITRTTRNLQARDHYLADLRHHAAQEDGIVRMGLFASGAAHELGTPLASLSVILNDWRRMPELANDSERAAELQDMQAEVERCKSIVTDILHSAGEPRGEAMESTAACGFLDDVVATWQPTHANVPLAYACDGLEGAVFVAGSSLRQAIWSLLDNAAEVSPGGIAVVATRRAMDLVVAVTDHGPGFAAGQLATIGRPYQSSKGAGHGLGLFLASNVARRLGGALEAGNRAQGGAEVKLILPLAPRRSWKS